MIIGCCYLVSLGDGHASVVPGDACRVYSFNCTTTNSGKVGALCPGSYTISTAPPRLLLTKSTSNHRLRVSITFALCARETSRGRPWAAPPIAFLVDLEECLIVTLSTGSLSPLAVRYKSAMGFSLFKTNLIGVCHRCLPSSTDSWRTTT